MQANLISHSQRIQTFGALQIYNAQSLLPLKGEKVRSLLAYLILYPRILHRRERLADMLWPDSPPERVRRNLSDLVYRLQKSVEPDWLKIDGNSIAFQPNADLQVDIWEFDNLVASQDPDSLQKAVELYEGDLLPEIYDDWVLVERELRRSQYLSALEVLSAYHEAHGNLQQALLYARRLILTEPLHEPAHQAYLRLLGRLKRFGEALAHYEYLCNLLRTELNSEPMAETRALIQSLERERDLENAPVVVEEARSFVGRKAERAAALTAVERMLNGSGGLLAVEGEAGIGKSRLLREVLAGARWRGAMVLQGQASGTPGASPFLPLSEALIPLINSPRGKQLETLLPAETLAALAPIHPLWGGKAGLQDVLPGQAGNRFYTALRTFGETLAQSTPVLLALDDLHWADPVLWECLRALAPGFAEHGGLLMLAYRRSEIEQLPGWKTIQDWDRDGLLKVISLGPLSAEEVEEFISGMANVDPVELQAWTGGNPFFIHEWLAQPELKPPEGRSAVSLRLQTLSSTAKTALKSASVLGENVPYQLWAEVSGFSSLVLADLGDELMARHWLQPSRAGYTFSHDLIRGAIYEGLEPVQRRLLHERAAHAYSTLDPDNLRARAFHLDQAGLAAEAARAYRLAGEQDLARFAFREARQSLDRALALLPVSPTVERIETALSLAEACEITGDQQRRRSVLEETLAGARRLENDALLLRALLALGQVQGQAAEVPEAKACFNEALTLARESSDQVRELEAIFELGHLESEQGQWKEAQKYYARALELAEAIADRLREADNAFSGQARRQVTSKLERIRKSIRTSLALQIGTLPAEVQQREAELINYRRNGDHLNELTTQMRLMGAYYNLCAWDRLLGTAGEALALAETLGDRAKAATAHHVLGLASYALGDTAGARHHLTQAERDYEATGLPRNAGLSRNVLGLVAENEGNHAEALSHYRAALAGAESRQTALEAAYARHDLGALLQHLDKTLEAIPLLEAARAAWSEQGNRFLCAKSEAFLGLALLATGERARARELAAQGWTVFQEGIPDGEQPQGWLWALQRLFTALGQPDRADEVLRAAYAELQRQAQTIGDPGLRESFFGRVSLNREIVAAYDQLAGTPRRLAVSLARRNVPLGRSLRADEFVSVQWTLHAPEDESIPDKSARRRHRLKRLLEEAAGQNAAPTDDDLARALEVSRRTILRDMRELTRENPRPPTRKRKG